MVGTAIGCKACTTGAARSFWSLLSFLFGQGSFLGYQGFQAIELCFGSASKGCCSFTSMTTQQKQKLINCFVKFGLKKVLVMLVKRFQHLQPTLCAADACNGQMFCCPQSFTTQSIQKAWARQVLLLVFKTGHWQDHFHGIQQVYHRMLNLGMDPWHPCWCSKNRRPASFSWNTAIPPTGSEAASGYSECCHKRKHLGVHAAVAGAYCSATMAKRKLRSHTKQEMRESATPFLPHPQPIDICSRALDTYGHGDHTSLTMIWDAC